MNTDPKILRLEERVQQIEEEMKVLGIFSDFLKRIEKIEATIFLNKDIFTFKEASIVLDMSHSQLYKMARNKSIPHYKTDRKIYFIKSELIDWLKQHPRKEINTPMTMDINKWWKWYHHIYTRTKFNPMNIEQTNKISLTELLSELGCMPVKKRRNIVYFNSPFYNDNKNSFEVDIVKNVWHDRGLNKGGDVISFGRLWHKSNNVEKVIDEFEKYEHLIIGHELSVKPIPKHDVDEMIMISCNKLSNHALLSYLRSRRIDINEAKIFAKEIIYRIEEKNYVALAFKTIYGGYLLHNPYFKGFLGKDGLSILHHETIGVQDTCCIFETYMDFLSYKTLESNGHKLMDTPVPCDYILLHSADYLHNCLQRLVSYKEIHLYLHHSLSGHTMKDTIYGLYKDKTIDESFRYIDDISLTKYLQYRR